MSRYPLTVYLERDQLLAVEKQARAAGMAKSAWAGQALIRALGEPGSESALLLDQTLKVRATLEELVAAHPQKEVIRKRTEVRVERYLAKAREAVSSSQAPCCGQSPAPPLPVRLLSSLPVNRVPGTPRCGLQGTGSPNAPRCFPKPQACCKPPSSGRAMADALNAQNALDAT